MLPHTKKTFLNSSTCSISAFKKTTTDPGFRACYQLISAYYQLIKNSESEVYAVKAYAFGGLAFKKNKTNDMDIVIVNVSTEEMALVSQYLESYNSYNKDSFPCINILQYLLGKGVALVKHYPNKVFGGYKIKMQYQDTILDIALCPFSLGQHARQLDLSISALYLDFQAASIVYPLKQAVTDFQEDTLDVWHHVNPIKMYEKNPLMLIRLVITISREPSFKLSKRLKIALNHYASKDTPNPFLRLWPDRMYLDVENLFFTGNAEKNFWLLYSKYNLWEKLFVALDVVTLYLFEKIVTFLDKAFYDEEPKSPSLIYYALYWNTYFKDKKFDDLEQCFVHGRNHSYLPLSCGPNLPSINLIVSDDDTGLNVRTDAAHREIIQLFLMEIEKGQNRKVHKESILSGCHAFYEEQNRIERAKKLTSKELAKLYCDKIIKDCTDEIPDIIQSNSSYCFKLIHDQFKIIKSELKNTQVPEDLLQAENNEADNEADKEYLARIFPECENFYKEKNLIEGEEKLTLEKLTALYFEQVINNLKTEQMRDTVRKSYYERIYGKFLKIKKQSEKSEISKEVLPEISSLLIDDEIDDENTVTPEQLQQKSSQNVIEDDKLSELYLDDASLAMFNSFEPYEAMFNSLYDWLYDWWILVGLSRLPVEMAVEWIKTLNDLEKLCYYGDKLCQKRVKNCLALSMSCYIRLIELTQSEDEINISAHCHVVNIFLDLEDQALECQDFYFAKQYAEQARLYGESLLKTLLKILEKKPGVYIQYRFDAYFNLGRAYSSESEPKARESFEEAYNLNPTKLKEICKEICEEKQDKSFEAMAKIIFETIQWIKKPAEQPYKKLIKQTIFKNEENEFKKTTPFQPLSATLK